MSTIKDNKQDDEADLFARCLLMPEQLFRKQFEKVANNERHTLQSISHRLAIIFKVEQVHVVIRITELKLHRRI